MLGDVVYMLPPAFPVTNGPFRNDDVVPPKRSMVAYQRLRSVGVGTTSQVVFNINAKDMLLECALRETVFVRSCVRLSVSVCEHVCVCVCVRGCVRGCVCARVNE
jgi:hypothetical protein